MLGTSVWAAAGSEKVGPPIPLLPLKYYGRTLAVPDNQLAEMRGGYRFANGLVVRFGLSFWTRVNERAPVVTRISETDLQQHSGVVNRVVVTNPVPSPAPRAATPAPAVATPAPAVATPAPAVRDSITVQMTNDFRGVMNVIQNDRHGETISNVTTMSIDLFNVNQAARAMNIRGRFDARSLLGY